MNAVEDRKWATVFIEIALRAIRRVHYDHGMWGVGRQWEMNRVKSRRLNMGPGIEIADERTVCAAITQEFLTSPSVTGLWVEESTNGSHEEERYFAIDRERKYETDDRKKVDIFIQKYEVKDKKAIPVKSPSFIEAKRARRWVPDIMSGESKREKLQVKGVQDDISKLRNEMASRQNDKIHCHVLVWGICGKDDATSCEDHPLGFFDKIDDNDVKMHQLRWLPIEWCSPSTQDIKDGKIEFPTVKKALWVALAEVFEESGK